MVKLQTRSGKIVHPIGIGTWGFGGTWEAEYGKEDEAVDAIRHSISQGQNHIDSAEIYGAGHTDDIVGRAIATLKREDLFLTDKLWENSLAEGKVRPAVEAMLKKLGTDYLDALYIHKPWQDFPWRKAIPQIDKLTDEGMVRHFGVSNFNLSQLHEAAELSRHPVTLAQIYFNVLHRQDAPQALRDYCEAQGVQIVAYKPLERGAVLENPAVREIADRHQAMPSQIALAWLIAHGAMPIPQATNREYIDQNLAALNIRLSDDDIAKLDSL